MHVEDLFALNARVERAATALARWRERMANNPEAHADDEPLERDRPLAGRTQLENLREYKPSLVDAPLLEGLQRWVYSLLQARIAHPAAIENYRARKREDGRYEGEHAERVSFDRARRELFPAKTAGGWIAWYKALADAAPGVHRAKKEERARRFEAAKRLGLAHPDRPLIAVEPQSIRAFADTFLRATDDLATALARELSGQIFGSVRGEGDAKIFVTFRAALGVDASEAWPRRVTAQWLNDSFAQAFAKLPIELPELPEPRGAASFARALYHYGFAVRHAGIARSVPFALRRDPAPVDAHLFGYAFGSILASPDLYVRVFRSPRRIALAESRLLARSALFTARMESLRLIAGDADRGEFEECSARVFGTPLCPQLAGVWPQTADDQSARVLALAQTEPFVRDLVNRFDEDWFHNPKAAAHLFQLAALPMTATGLSNNSGALDGSASASALARRFEEALG